MGETYRMAERAECPGCHRRTIVVNLETVTYNCPRCGWTNAEPATPANPEVRIERTTQMGQRVPDPPNSSNNFPTRALAAHGILSNSLRVYCAKCNRMITHAVRVQMDPEADGFKVFVQCHGETDTKLVTTRDVMSVRAGDAIRIEAFAGLTPVQTEPTNKQSKPNTEDNELRRSYKDRI